MKHFILIILCAFVGIQSLQAQIPQKKRDFEFWVGEWNVYKYGTDTLVGKSSIQSIIDGHAILEKYTAIGSAYEGTSLNKYNTDNGKWEQYYVDNTGLTLHLTGQFSKNKMVLENKVTKGNEVTRNRITWESVDQDQVRQIWSQKKHKTNQNEPFNWQVIFDGIYKSRSM